MLKKSTLALTSAGVLSLAAVKAHHIGACDFELGNCTGYFYEDISAAFVDCYDANGVLASRKEAFFTSPLQKDCNSTSGALFYESLNGTNPSVPSNITSVSDIQVCDYYSYGEGYEFSQAGSGIGLVILPDRYNTSIALSYQNGSPSTSNSTVSPAVPIVPTLNWNWSELSGLIQQLTNIQCSSVNATANVTVPSVNVSGFNILAALNLPWSSWSQLANLNLDISTWAKSDWKMWIQNYVTYYNAIQQYIAEGEAVLAGIASGVSSVAGQVVGEVSGVAGNLVNQGESAVGSYESQISSGIAEARALLAQGALLISQNIQINGTANFTDFWSPNFDLDTVSVGDIKNDLNIASNVVSQVEGFFTTFFVQGTVQAILGQNTTYVIEGANGMETNITTGSASGSVVINVPNEVEAIVAWITANFNSELVSILSDYNVTFAQGSVSVAEVNSTESNSTVNGTDNSTNATSGSNSTNGTVVDNNSTNSTNGTVVDNNNSTIPVDNSTGSGNGGNVSLFVNYTLPSGCAYTDAQNDTVRCSSGINRGVTFTIAQISEFFSSQAQEVCTDYTTASSNCQSNTVITDLTTCLQLSLYNQFQLAQETVIYGWLSYDVVARNAIFGVCQSSSNSFSGVSSQFSSAFGFSFPNIN